MENATTKLSINMERDFNELNEQYRVYTFPNGETVRIEEPKALNVSKSGGHRIVDAKGISYYIPSKWIYIQWEVKQGTPYFIL